MLALKWIVRLCVVVAGLLGYIKGFLSPDVDTLGVVADGRQASFRTGARVTPEILVKSYASCIQSLTHLLNYKT